MPKDGRLVLNLLDANRNFIGGKVDISLKHQVLAHGKIARQVSASKPIRISGLHREPQGIYRILIDPRSYQPVSQFAHIQPSGDTYLNMHFPVDPDKVEKPLFPAFGDHDERVREILVESDCVLGLEGMKGKALYDKINDISKAGLHNIIAKCRRTMLPNGTNVLDHVHQFTELRGDRFFAAVTHALREEVKTTVPDGLFHEADDSLHHPPVGFERAGSFKTDDRYGNLQISFFAKGDQWRADVDIDDASGLGHVFQVVRNFLTGRPTHPFDIHQILLLHQRLDPKYGFKLY